MAFPGLAAMACMALLLLPGTAWGAEPQGRPDGTVDTYLRLADALRSSCGWGTARQDASVTGAQLRIGSKGFDQGIGTHAPAELVFALDGREGWLTFYAGVSAAMTEKGSVTVQVWLDGRMVHETPVLRVREEPLYVSLPLKGARELRLVGTDALDGAAADHINLCNLRLAAGLSGAAGLSEPRPDAPEPPALAGLALPPEAPLSLWYRRPASRWLEALPVGNGRLGAMVHGGVRTERLSLNESTFWSGAPSDAHENPDGRARLQEIRDLFFKGRYREAVGLTAQHLLGRTGTYGTHLPLGELRISLRHGDGEVRDYRRWLDLDEAVARTAYTAGGARFTREVLASHPDGILAVRLAADRPGSISFTVGFRGGGFPWQVRSREPDALELSGEAREGMHSDGKTGVSFRGTVRALAQGGTVTSRGGVLEVAGADAATLLIDLATDFGGRDPAALCAGRLAAAAGKCFEGILRDHVADHRGLFRRVALDLGPSPAAALPTDERLKRLREGGDDPALAALFFQYGRYLLIAGSREDSPLPTNLQGIWNDGLACAMGWTCDFHLDINTEQNYWPAEVTNLSECHEPLFRLIESLRAPGRRTARVVYGARGWVCHVFTNAWGYTAPGWGLGWGMHPVGGIWIALHLWDRYEFTGDREFLERRAWPVLKEAAEFFLDYLTPHPTRGFLVTGPSTSPENAFVAPDGSVVSESMGPTHDIVLVRWLFTACLEAGAVLGADREFRAKVEEALSRLPPLQVGKHGQLQEWLEDFEEAVPNHRHTSHLAALYPGREITPRRAPALARAARTTLERRMGRPDWEDVEWSRANAIAYFARLGDGEGAHGSVLVLLRKLTDTNLFTFSAAGIAGAQDNIFCVDGNSAGTAAMAEMLLQSQPGGAGGGGSGGMGEIELLPALPRAWPQGSVRGLRARGGFEVDISWKEGRLAEAVVRSLLGAPCRLRCGAAMAEVRIPKGETFRWTGRP